MLALPTAQDFYKSYHHFFRERKVLFIFDFDGTLADITSTPEETVLPEETREDLRLLYQLSTGKVFVISGRPFGYLYSILGKDLHFVSEHGFESNFFELTDKGDFVEGIPLEELEYLYLLTEEYPGSFVEMKPHSSVWHYRKCKDLISVSQAEVLSSRLNQRLTDSAFECKHYNAVLEIKPSCFSKKKYVQTVMDLNYKDHLIVSFGDDRAEEEIFQTQFKQRSLSVAVGEQIGHATYQCASPAALREWIKELNLHWGGEQLTV